MLHDNYNQALVIVKHDDHVVEEAKSYSLHIMDEGLKSWKTAQDEYFLTVGDESESQVCAIAYVELLQKLRQLESKYTSIIYLQFLIICFITLTPDNFPARALLSSWPYTHHLLMTRKLEAKNRCAFKLCENCLKQIVNVEVSMGIDRWWDSSSHAPVVTHSCFILIMGYEVEAY